jgi:hypothetical protein
MDWLLESGGCIATGARGGLVHGILLMHESSFHRLQIFQSLLPISGRAKTNVLRRY